MSIHRQYSQLLDGEIDPLTLLSFLPSSSLRPDQSRGCSSFRSCERSSGASTPSLHLPVRSASLAGVISPVHVVLNRLCSCSSLDASSPRPPETVSSDLVPPPIFPPPATAESSLPIFPPPRPRDEDGWRTSRRVQVVKEGLLRKPGALEITVSPFCPFLLPTQY